MVRGRVSDVAARSTAYRISLPLRRPHDAAHGSEAVRDVIVVEHCRADGAVGWGECPTLAAPTYTSEHTEGAWQLLRSGLALAAVGHPMLTGALRDAALDAAAVAQDRPLAWRCAQGLATCEVVAAIGARPDEVVARVAAALATGAALVKVKVAPGHDVALLEAIRSTLPDAPLAADANGSYVGVPERARALDRFGLRYLEQPLAADDLVGHRDLSAAMATSVALDESVTGPATVRTLASLGATRLVISVKPSRVGGWEAAVATLHAVGECGFGAFVGGMLETGVGRASAVALATHPVATLPTDLGPSDRYFDQDVTGPVVSVEGRLQVPPGPGFGGAPVPARLAQVTTDTLDLPRP